MGKSAVLKDFFNKQEFVPAEDYDLFAYLIAGGYRITNIVNALTNVTIHENSVSNSLKFLTIRKRFALAKNYFQFRKSLVGSYFEYLHQFFYRRYLFEESSIRYFYLFMSALSMPIKTSTKIFK